MNKDIEYYKKELEKKEQIIKNLQQDLYNIKNIVTNAIAKDIIDK